MGIHAGTLDRSITIQENSQSVDSYGELTGDNWANIATNPTVRASVMELLGSEKYEEMQLSEKADLKIRIRYRSDLTVRMRIVYESQNYDIYSIQEVGRRVGTDIFAKLATDVIT